MHRRPLIVLWILQTRQAVRTTSRPLWCATPPSQRAPSRGSAVGSKVQGTHLEEEGVAMSKLVLKFEASVLKEVSVGGKEVSIGRSPDNGIVIDNPAVSHYHARVFKEEDRLMLEDFGSMNGTFVNGQRVKMVTLKPGDSVGIGKHTIVVSESREMDGFATGNGGARPPAPKINETVMLDTRERREFLQKVAAVGESSQVAPSRLRVPTLIVRKGRTDQREYAL